MKTFELESDMTKSELSIKCARVIRGLQSGVSALSPSANSPFLTEPSEFKNCCEALMLENHCIAGLAEKRNSYVPKLLIRIKRTLLQEPLF